MNPWLKTILVAAFTTIVTAALSFILSNSMSPSTGNVFVEATVLVAFILGLALQATAILAAWAWHRWISKQRDRYFSSSIFATCVSFAMLIIFLHIVSDDWFGKEFFGAFVYFGPHPAIMCGVPLVYLLFCKKRQKVNPAEAGA